MHCSLPAAFICEAVAQGPHMIANCRPFCTADDANVLHGQDSKEEVFVCSVIPVLVHFGRCILKLWYGTVRALMNCYGKSQGFW
jgi:hypothetical protein